MDKIGKDFSRVGILGKIGKIVFGRFFQFLTIFYRFWTEID